MTTKQSNKRFNQFKSALANELGDKASLMASGEVMVAANEFSPVRFYRSVQDAIDSFARFMPETI